MATFLPPTIFGMTSGQWQILNAGNPALDDADDWNQPQYYETLRLADINGDGQAELIFRGPFGLFTWAFDRAQGQWQRLDAGDLGLYDTAGWNLPQYYRTLRLADIDGDGKAELVIRGTAGLLTFAFDTRTSKWVNIESGVPALTDADKWNQPEYYETIQLADINGDGQAELIFRGPFGLFTWAFVQGQWQNLNAGDLGLYDTAGWNQPQYYRTLRLADINGDGQAELLIRGAAGLRTYAFDTRTSKWVGLNAGLLGLADVHLWNSPEYYSTIAAADIDGDGQSELLARSDAGIISWHYTLPSSDQPVLFQAPSNQDADGYEVSYRFDPDPSLPNGTFAVQEVVKVPAGDSNRFTCMLVNSQGRRIGGSIEASAAAAGVSAPFPLTALPGRFAIAYLNRQNSNLPALVVPILLPEELATRANQSRITFTWSVVPNKWSVITTALNNQVSLECNGTSVYGDIGNPDDLQITNQITMQAWIRPTASDGLRNIIAHGYSLTPKGEVYLRIANGQYQAGSWDGVDHVATSPMPLSDLGRWVYLCGVYDGTQWILYRNGQAVASSPDTTGAVQVQASWAIGARGGGGERFFSGRLRNVALWKAVRTAQDFKNDMLSSPAQNELDLAVYWPLDDGLPSSPPYQANAIGQASHTASLQGTTTSPWFEPQSLDPLVQLLPTPLPNFTTSLQQKAYTTISEYISSTGPLPGNGIREAYLNEANKDLFSLWNGTLRNDQSIPPWAQPPEIWNSEDWQVVRYTLASELENVSRVWQLSVHTNNLLDKLLTIQATTLKKVADTLSAALTTAPATLDSAGYWATTILGYALGILSLIPEAKVAQVALLAGSDVAGAVAPVSNDQPMLQSIDPSLPQQIQDQLNAAYQALLQLNGQRTDRILRDGLLLPIVSRLAQTVWGWGPTDFGDLPTLVVDKYRLSFYQRLIPNQYVVSEWRNHWSAEPILYPYPPPYDLHGAPSYACWSTRSSQKRQHKWEREQPPPGLGYNLYIIHTPGDPYNGTDWHGYPGMTTKPTISIKPEYYPLENILQELFETLEVPKEDFFTCTNGWENTSFTAQEVQYNIPSPTNSPRGVFYPSSA